MRIAILVIFTLFLPACTLTPHEFSLPKRVDFAGKTFVKVTDNRLDELQQLLYLPEQGEKNPENWEQGILFFLDRNLPQQTLKQRANFRQKHFAEQPQIQANVEIIGNELQSQIAYPPTERYPNVLLEVSQGRNLACGYGQIQYSTKQAVKNAKNLPNLTAYQPILFQLAQSLAQLPWLVTCK